MIDSTSLSLLSLEQRKAVDSAILTIANSGVIENQRRSNLERVLAGSREESTTDLAERILQLRRDEYALDSFLELANTVKENFNA